MFYYGELIMGSPFFFPLGTMAHNRNCLRALGGRAER